MALPPPDINPAPSGWHRFSAAEPTADEQPLVAVYGADLPT
jgi:hypothetical protein